jgi:ATP-dependent helicase/nuclease subunit B
MSLRFVLGRAGSGKSEYCLQEIEQEVKKNPFGATVLYIVPDQMTFQAQQALAARLGGTIRAQVFSFTRLAWKVLLEVGGASRLHIDQIGINMLLRKIVELKKKELKVFQKASEQNGFYEQLSAMIAELKRYNLTPAELHVQQQELELNSAKTEDALLATKLHDLQLLYEEFEKALIGKYLDSEDYLRLLCEKLPLSQYIKDADVYIDGFHTFAPQELEVIKGLLKHCARVNVLLTLEEPCENKIVDELSLFCMTSKTYQKVYQLAKELQQPIQAPVLLTEQRRFTQSPSLAHLEKHYDARPYKPFFADADITIYSAVNRRAEIENIAREIIKLVREKGYRYRDIAVMLRNGNDYYDIIQTVFKDYGVPYYIDQKRSMLNHPLIECIRSGLEVINGNWRYEAVFRTIKTELLFPADSDKKQLREEMDAFENYCLAYGVQGKKWTNEERWVYRKYRGLEGVSTRQTDEELEFENKINELRILVAEPLLQLQKRLKRAKSVRQMCEALYLFLEGLKVPQKLEAMRAEAEQEGNLIFASDHEQVWQEVIALLDKCVEVLGDEKLSLDMFTKVIETGLESLEFANIPASLDQVLIANIDRSRLSNIQAVFLIGVNEGVIPMIPSQEGMISDQEREVLLASGVELASTGRQKLLDESFVMYNALTRASRKLYISYPLADEEGKTLLPSSLLKRIKGMFPRVQDLFVTNDVNDLSIEKQFNYVTNPAMTLSYLTQQLQRWKRYGVQEDLSFWWDVYNFYVNSPEWKFRSSRVLSSLFYRNEAKSLAPDVSQQLYGNEIQGSVSRMELFQSCAYAHFVQHGLSLKERDLFKLNAPDIGQLFHEALKTIAHRLLEEKKGWEDLTPKECEHLAFEAIEQLAPLLQREILLSSNRFYYLKRKLQQIISRASIILSEHAKVSGFVPVDLEVPFGFKEKGTLPPMQFQLKNGVQMSVVGRIDRVDKAESENGIFLRIIDYKSSAKTLDMGEVYYGLALQMLTYLDVVVTNASKWVGNGKDVTPAGVLYFHIHNPMIDVKKDLSQEGIEQEILKKFKMKGLLLGDEAAVRLMDKNLETGHSDIVSAGLKKDGSFYANSAVASRQEFDVLKKYVRRTFEKIGTNITEGVIDIAPYKMKDKTPCTFCQFKSVCQFDESLEENNYRTLRPLKGADVLQKMREEVEPQ